MFKTLILAMAAFVAAAASFAMPVPVPTEVWADRNEVSSLDMSPDANKIAMLMRRSIGGQPEIFIFETGDINGTIKAIEVEELRPTSIRWVDNDYLIVEFSLDMGFQGRPEALSRTASYNVNTGEWVSLVRITSRIDRGNYRQELINSTGIGSLESTLPEDPDHVLISHSESLAASPNYYRTNFRTGVRTRVLRGGIRFEDYTFDHTGQARGATEYDVAKNRYVTFARENNKTPWKEIGALEAENRESFSLSGFFDFQKPRIATILATTPDTNYTAAYELNIVSGEKELVFAVEGADVTGVLRSPRWQDAGRPVGFVYADKDKNKPYYTDGMLASLDAGLSQAFPDRSVQIIRISEDGNTILAYTWGPRDSGTWYLVRDGKVAPVISANSKISADSLSPTKTVEFMARDGMELIGYITTPLNAEGPFPTIAMPHGGPWVRDQVGYDGWAQMLANQGYAVFQPNYRGSRGLGKGYWLAGDNQWGLKMQDDVEDGMQYLVERGIADPAKLAIFGWSYGGYSAFAAATREEQMFNCIVSGAGVSDLSRMRGGMSGSRWLRAYQKPTITGVSPLDYVENVQKPMLIIHGDYDRIVPVEESRRFVRRLEQLNKDFKYIEIEDMRHSPSGPSYFKENMQWFPDLFEFFETRCGF